MKVSLLGKVFRLKMRAFSLKCVHFHRENARILCKLAENAHILCKLDENAHIFIKIKISTNLI